MKVQGKVKELEAEEQERWMIERDQKLSIIQTQLMKKHSMEKNALQIKVQSLIEAKRKQRAMEIERLLQKYNNIMKGVEYKHGIEMKNLSKRGVSGSSTYSSYSSTELKKSAG